jgi:outer membrane protein assembly factor BamB
VPGPAMRSLLILVAGLVSAAEEWPQFRGNPQLTGIATGSVPADLKLLWSFDAGESIESAVAGGVAYLSGCDEVFHGVRLADGREILQFPSGGYTGASVALLGQTAFYGTFSNEVIGVDVRQQRIVWRYQHPRSQFPFYSSAAVAGHRILLGGRDKLIHCLNAKTGKALWTFATRARVDSSPAIAGGRVYVGSDDGHFYVLDLAGGKKLWDFDAGAALSASPAIAAGRVVIGSQDGRLYCFGQSATVQGK